MELGENAWYEEVRTLLLSFLMSLTDSSQVTSFYLLSSENMWKTILTSDGLTTV